jgi:hypothetical protein
LNANRSIVLDSSTSLSYQILRRNGNRREVIRAGTACAIKSMVNCYRCGTSVREEKAFCHNCGAPMNAAKAERELPLPDFGATVIVPPRVTSSPPPPQQPLAPPAVTEVQPAGRANAPVSPSPAAVPIPTPPGALPVAKRKSPWKIGFRFLLFLLFLMFLVFVLAILID